MSVQYDSDAHSPPLPTLAHGKEETLIDGPGRRFQVFNTKKILTLQGEPSGSSGNSKFNSIRFSCS